MQSSIRRSAAAAAAIGALGLGGAAIAGAAGNGSSSQDRPARAQREALPADAAAKVKAAALERVPGATVLRTEAGGPYPSPYHAHIERADGTTAVVLVDARFEAIGVQAERSGRGGHPGHGGPMDRALTGDRKEQVEAAALEEVPGATVLRSEAGGPYPTPYHVHVERANGSRAVVLVDAQLEATGVQAEHARGGGRGPGRP